MPEKILAIICSTFQSIQTIFIRVAVTFVNRTFIISLTASIYTRAASSTGPINICLTISTCILNDNEFYLIFRNYGLCVYWFSYAKIIRDYITFTHNVIKPLVVSICVPNPTFGCAATTVGVCHLMPVRLVKTRTSPMNLCSHPITFIVVTFREAPRLKIRSIQGLAKVICIGLRVFLSLSCALNILFTWDVEITTMAIKGVYRSTKL